jgi:hypothetical protein
MSHSTLKEDCMQAGCVQFFSLKRSGYAATMATAGPERRSRLFPPPSCHFSFSCLRRQLQLGLGFNFCWERKRKKGKRSVGHAAIIDRSLRRGRVTFSLPLVCIPSLKEVGCFGVDLNLFFLPLLVIPRPVFPFLLTP